MRKTKATKAFEQIAARDGVSVEKVRNEIQMAIDAGFASPDLAVQKHWSNMNYRGEKPTPEEVVLHLAKQVKKRTR